MVRRRAFRKGKNRITFRRKTASLAKQIAQLRKRTTPETKWVESFDITSNNEFCEQDSASPFDIPLVNVGQGTGQHDRIGHTLKIKSLYGRITLNAPTGAFGRLFRFVMYIPKDPTDSMGTAVGGVSPLKIGDQIDQDRFTVLMDKSYHIAPTHGSLANLKQIVIGKRFKKMIRQQYDSSATNSVVKNDIRLYVVATQGVGSANKTFLQGYMKTYYIDP